MAVRWPIGVKMKSLTTCPTVVVTRYRRIPTMPAGKYAVVSSKWKSLIVCLADPIKRDPERVLVEERAKALSPKGYPLQLDDDSAMYAEQRLKEARAAAPSLQADSDSGSTAGDLSARGMPGTTRCHIRAKRDGQVMRSDLGRPLCWDVHGRHRGMEHHDLQRL